MIRDVSVCHGEGNESQLPVFLAAAYHVGRQVEEETGHHDAKADDQTYGSDREGHGENMTKDIQGGGGFGQLFLG